MVDPTYARTAKRIVSICDSKSSGTDIRAAVLAELRTSVPFDSHVWLRTDPVTTVGVAPHADVPSLNELPALIKSKYLTVTNRWTNMADAGIRASSLAATTGGRLRTVDCGVAGKLLANEAGIDGHPAHARIHHGRGTWLTAGATRAGIHIAVTLEISRPADRLEMFALSHALSPRESEILRLLADGSDTKEVATHLFLSELTVQDHLKTMFVKSHTHNRRTLLARILGVQA